jgi:glucan phosphoethanolaminetransferase (alkaline phosphatase superfamily)
MFDFLDNDYFVIVLEIIFLIFIIYDFRKWLESKKREYLINIALAIAFFIYTAIPFYNKYYTWSDQDKNLLNERCLSEHNTTLCDCLNDKIIKEYSFSSFKTTDEKELKEFMSESKKECLED